MSTSTSPGRGPRWEFWVDRGGTFTDVVGRRPDGSLATAKLLSQNPMQYADSALAGIRLLLGVAADQPLPVERIASVKMGTTVATNALLERTGEPTVLVITRGFRDALRIAYQNRPRLFDRHIVLPELLYTRVIEVDERIGAHGEVLVALDETTVRADLEACLRDGYRCVAIVFMHGYRYDEHESRVAAIARQIGFEQVSVSHEVSPLMKLVSRGDTTVVDAYLSPILRRYVDHVTAELPGVALAFMQSNGGLTDARRFQGKDSILSGPAGGVVGAVRTAHQGGFDRIIGFDMGGTSTDVSHFAGDFERTFETVVAGVRMRAPMMSINTVAAGGGSVLHFDGARYRVGPDSAGADPGPACYRRGGPLALTDANVMLGKIQPDHFPRVFGDTGGESIDPDVVRTRFEALAARITEATGDARRPEEVAEGFVEIAVGNMANAIKAISVQRGHDVTQYALCTFGAAGGQHACLVADALGMTRVFVHPLAGVLSAYGMGLADQTSMREQTVELPLQPASMARVEHVIDELEEATRADLLTQGVDEARVTARRRVHLRYEGTDTALLVDFAAVPAMVDQFEAAYRQRYSFLMPSRALVVEAVSSEATSAAEGALDAAPPPRAGSTAPQPTEWVRMFSGGRWHHTPVHRREALRPGTTLVGPAIIAEANATTVAEHGWAATMTAREDLVLERVQPRPSRVAVGTHVDPVRLEVFNNLFMSVAEQMGVRLANTAHSVNIKERLDFSCALFDRSGALIANAPHIPVHLGSMSESVRAVVRENAGIRPGDVFATNAPYNGGTHLPDITVITPVFDKAGRDILFHVASRGHHADIGGLTPGSMPPLSHTIDEEGVLLDNWQLVAAGRLREDETRAVLRSGPFPARNVEQNLADLRAQVAANEKGVQELRGMVEHFGLDVVHAYMRHVQDNAEEAVRRVIDVLTDGAARVEMDNGGVIDVSIAIERSARQATLDFSGSSRQLPGNYNAPAAVAMSAVLYVFRTLVDDDIPLNAGCLKPLVTVIPSGTLLRPRYPSAVVAGNVETSQCVTDALYAALGVLANSAGTMNNFTFGNERHQYYETVAGGSGAGPGFDGTDCVQTHMTNSRLTDPEVLEWRFPVVLELFERRRGSGGAGRWRGGDGARRRVRFLEPMTAAIVAGRRRLPPRGMAGGADAAVGRNWVERADGSLEQLGWADQAQMRPGDVFVIETPGGGGYGAPPGETT
ncbi:MAG: hydantoinase B/oxoprolinase family protein [Dermatophilaceae bacterium]